MERIHRTKKKSKTKLVVVLKNRSKKLRPCKEKKEIEYIQKGGANYDVTLYSNYTFLDGTSVDDKLKTLNGNRNDNNDLTNIDSFFSKCVKFLTDDDFATFYLKSNFTVNDGTNDTKINTSAETLLNFQSLILLEMCLILFSDNHEGSISPNGKLIENSDTPSYFANTQIVLARLTTGNDLDPKISENNVNLLYVFTYRLFKHFIDQDDDNKTYKKNISSQMEDSIPFTLILLNYIINEFTNENREMVEQIDNKDGKQKLKVGENFISYKMPSTDNIGNIVDDKPKHFKAIVTRLLKYKTDYVDVINKKFNYTYEQTKANDALNNFFSIKTLAIEPKKFDIYTTGIAWFYTLGPLIYTRLRNFMRNIIRTLEKSGFTKRDINFYHYDEAFKKEIIKDPNFNETFFAEKLTLEIINEKILNKKNTLLIDIAHIIQYIKENDRLKIFLHPPKEDSKEINIISFYPGYLGSAMKGTFWEKFIFFQIFENKIITFIEQGVNKQIKIPYPNKQSQGIHTQIQEFMFDFTTAGNNQYGKPYYFDIGVSVGNFYYSEDKIEELNRFFWGISSIEEIGTDTAKQAALNVLTNQPAPTPEKEKRN